MKFYEKLIISLVVFVTTTIGTAAIIGNYVRQKREIKEREETTITLENVNLFNNFSRYTTIGSK